MAIQYQQTSPLEIKELDEEGRFSGFGAVYSTIDQVEDVIHPGAFAKSLERWTQRGAMPPVLWGHNINEPIGSYSKIEETDAGLWVEGQLLVKDVQRAREAYALAKANVVGGLSIGYDAIKYDFKGSTRHLYELELYEVSMTAFPAHLDAKIMNVKDRIKRQLKSGEPVKPAEWEKLLRDAGLSKSQATAFVSHGYKALGQSESDSTEALENLLSIIRG